MAHIQDRWFKVVIRNGKRVKEKTAQHGVGNRYKVRYTKPDGTEGSKTFPDGERGRAEDHLIQVQNDIRTGSYIDEKRGLMPFKLFSEEWLDGYDANDSTLELVAGRLKNIIVPFFGEMALCDISALKVNKWIKQMTADGLKPSTQHHSFGIFAGIMISAKEDKRIRENPCDSKTVRRPTIPDRKIVPWDHARVEQISTLLPPHYAAVPYVGEGTGARIGEIMGLSPDDLSSDGLNIHIQRQVKYVNGTLIFSLPKRDKTRWTPLPTSTKERLDGLTVVPVTLPWGKPSGPLVTVRLYFTTLNGTAVNPSNFSNRIWGPRIEQMGLPRDYSNGPHATRHSYASVLLDEGVSVLVVSSNLGHTSPAFTMKVYGHLMPNSGDQTRAAIDALSAPPAESDKT